MTLKTIFEEYADREFAFVTPGGNQGDQMIYAGAEKLADEVGLTYETVLAKRSAEPEPFEEDKVIYLHGGGGFAPWWNWTPRLLAYLRKHNPQSLIIVGPSTVALQKWYLKKYLPPPKNLIFFARELTSYKFLREHFYPEAMLDDDTSLHLDKYDPYLDKILEGEEPIRLFRLIALREDPESPDEIPKSIRNLSPRKYPYIVDPCQTDKWAFLHAKASHIVTNRSHSAIMGAILGKTTSIFAGRYHKNRSIWVYSLKKRGVQWLE